MSGSAAGSLVSQAGFGLVDDRLCVLESGWYSQRVDLGAGDAIRRIAQLGFYPESLGEPARWWDGQPSIPGKPPFFAFHAFPSHSFAFLAFIRHPKHSPNISRAFPSISEHFRAITSFFYISLPSQILARARVTSHFCHTNSLKHSPNTSRAYQTLPHTHRRFPRISEHFPSFHSFFTPKLANARNDSENLVNSHKLGKTRAPVFYLFLSDPCHSPFPQHSLFSYIISRKSYHAPFLFQKFIIVPLYFLLGRYAAILAYSLKYFLFSNSTSSSIKTSVKTLKKKKILSPWSFSLS